jgi:purine-nucleoside phosphorylase
MTPHITAKLNEIASTVLMPGDPLRAKWIAETFLSKPKLVNSVRGMFCFTGTYKNKKVSVMAHGMGMPSIGIYSYELFHFYKIKNIIRIGSCGSLDKKVNLGDVVICDEAFSYSVYAKDMGIKVSNHTLRPSPSLLKLCETTAKQVHIKKYHKAKVLCEDAFYNIYSVPQKIKRSNGSKVVEMEAFALYANAIKEKKNALCLLTVSDSLVTHESMPPLQRQTSFKDMVVLALETAIKAK